MNYFYIIFPFAVWIISQTIKFLIRLNGQQVPRRLKDAIWVYVWAGGAPSTHSAILTSTLVLVWDIVGFSPVFTFCLSVTALWMYDMISERKKQELLDSYFSKDKSKELQREVREGYELDLAGHTLNEVMWGIILGLALGFISVFLL